jgi:hypothetical protein
MQARVMCKRANKTSGSLDGDPTVYAILSLKPSHHLVEFFNQPLMLASICIYGWILIQKFRRLLARLHLNLAYILVVALIK